MRFYRVILMIFAAVTIPSIQSRADDAGSVMKNFDLVGTWSNDCSKDPKKFFSNSRTVLTVPYFGKPTQTTTTRVMFDSSDDVMIVTDEIQSATRITEDKLQYVSLKVKREDSNPDIKPAPASTDPFVVLIRKFGPQIRVIESRLGDHELAKYGIMLTAGQPTNQLERCLNDFR